MSVSVNWATKIISIPKAYLTFISGSTYEMDLDTFRLDLKSLEDSEAGMIFPDTHKHTTEAVLGGVTYARFVEIINGYTVTFEDGQYIVNLVGANNNILDIANLNQVSVRSANSAGLITVVSGSGVTEQDKEDIANEVWSHTDGIQVSGNIDKIKRVESGRWKINPTTKQMIFYDSDGETSLLTFDLKDKTGQPSSEDVYERVPA